MLLARPGGGGGLEGGTGGSRFVYQKWPDKIFPVGIFVFFHNGHFGLEGGGGPAPPPPPPPMVYGNSNTSLGEGCPDFWGGGGG